MTIATPNHWHSLATIWACEAGKDVYVEKPLSHNIFEGKQVVAAAKKYGRIVQHGTQSRANAQLIRDMKLIHDGFIGKIVESRGYVYKNGNRGAIGHGKPGPVPTNLDWALWQGPSRDHEFLLNADRAKPGLYVHYDWHYFWEYGNGEIGNQGVHEMDIAVWGHNRGLPNKIFSAGGRFLDDDGQTPNTQATTFSYPDGSILTFEVRNLGSFEEADAGPCSNSFFGTKGFYVRNKGFFTYGSKKSKREAIRGQRATRRQGQQMGPLLPRGALARSEADVGEHARRARVVRALPLGKCRVPVGSLAGVRRRRERVSRITMRISI